MSGKQRLISSDISLPSSKTKFIPHPGIAVQVSPSRIWVEGKLILDANELPQTLYNKEGHIIPLLDALTNKKKDLDNLGMKSKLAKKFSGKINLAVDKTLKYFYIKKILDTCKASGFSRTELIVNRL